MGMLIHLVLASTCVLLYSSHLEAQPPKLTIGMVVEEYALQSPKAEIAKIDYHNNTIDYENFKRDYLPSIAMQFNPVSFNNSIRTLQSPLDGNYSYVKDNSNNSSIGVNIRQKIGVTGGVFSAGSSLNMLSEFTDGRYTFSTTPFTLGYSQNLFGGRKIYLWTKNIANKKNTKALKDYCRTIANIQKQAVTLYMNLLLCTLSKEVAFKHMTISDTLVQTGKIRMDNGTLLEQEYLQLKLQAANDSYNYENLKKTCQSALNELFVYLGIPNPKTEYSIEPPSFGLPGQIVYSDFIPHVERNDPFFVEQEIEQINNEKQYYEARIIQRVNSNINLNYGLNQYGNSFTNAYKHPSSQQSVTIGLQIPIFQWGKGAADIKLAKNRFEASGIKQEQALIEFYNQVKELVDNYNHNVQLMRLSKQSLDISQKSYNLTVQRFNLERATIYELTTAQKENMNAMKNYYNSIRDVWNGYYSLRSMALFDIIQATDLMVLYPIDNKYEK